MVDMVSGVMYYNGALRLKSAVTLLRFYSHLPTQVKHVLTVGDSSNVNNDDNGTAYAAAQSVGCVSVATGYA